MNWSSSLITSDGSHVIIRQNQLIKESIRCAKSVGDFRYAHCEGYSLDPQALGAKGEHAMRELGFFDLNPPDNLAKDDGEQDSRKKIKPIQKMVTKLFAQFRLGNEIAAYMDIELLPRGDMGGYDGLLSCRLKQIGTSEENLQGAHKLRELFL